MQALLPMYIVYNQLQVQLEEVTKKEELAQKQLESMKGSNKEAHQKCQELEAENKQLTEQISKLGGASADESALINQLLHQAKKLEQEKETLQNEVQIAKTEVCTYNFCFLCVSLERWLQTSHMVLGIDLRDGFIFV